MLSVLIVDSEGERVELLQKGVWPAVDLRSGDTTFAIANLSYTSRVLITAPAIGDFSGKEGYIAYYQLNLATWTFYKPKDGLLCRVLAEKDSVLFYEYLDGGWSAISLPAGTAGGGSGNRRIIDSGEIITNDSKSQHLLYGNFTINNGGEFINDSGDTTLLNGNLLLNGTGTFTNNGTGTLNLILLQIV